VWFQVVGGEYRGLPEQEERACPPKGSLFKRQDYEQIERHLKSETNVGTQPEKEFIVKKTCTNTTWNFHLTQNGNPTSMEWSIPFST